MFKRSTNKQIDMFKDMSIHLSKRKQKIFGSPTSWHNIFYQEVVYQIDESIYSVLYDDRMGRPNASARILIGMMILKEGNGWSDEQLFEESRFNIKVMRALGLANMDEDVPVESTYYEFRRLLEEHYKETGEDLLKITFQQITATQVRFHDVSGKKIRLDSKLINSNIAKSNRLQLIVEAVRKYLQGVELPSIAGAFDNKTNELLAKIQQRSASNITYPLNGAEKKELLINMGGIIQTLLNKNANETGKYYQLLKRIYEEQYEERINDGDDTTKGKKGEEKIIIPKAAKEIKSSSVQSIHDPEAAYRTKGEGASKQSVSGYHTNITESCDPEDGINLILDVETVAANKCEDDFLLKTVEQSQEVLKRGNKSSLIEEVITDGGYDSISNREAMLEEDQPKWSIAKMKGGKRIYEIKKNKQGDIEVYDKKSKEQLEIHFSERAQKYVLKKNDGTKRYMTSGQINNYINYQDIVNQVNKESYNLRASVESTIHQEFHRLKKRGKVVYRGLLKCQWYAISRAFWVNLVRIVAKEVKKVMIIVFLVLQSLMELPNSKKMKFENYSF